MLSSQYVQQVSMRTDTDRNDDDYPFSLPAVRHLAEIKFHPKVTFFVGENGTGKSTLLEAIAVGYGFNPEGGSKNFNFSTCQSHSELFEHIRIGKGFRQPKDNFFLRAESFFNLATAVDNVAVEHAYGGKSLHRQSHGESFMALMLNRFRGKGFYVLDEPEAALSPQRQLAALVRIHELAQDDSQFIIATHSPILMAYPDAYIYEFSHEGIQRVAYEDTEHYQVMHAFLRNPQRMLNELLGAEGD